MFWNGNYVVAREIASLLKEQNVTLAQLIEADDIIQECQSENKDLVQFLTKPEVLAELISLITEEPSKNVELQSQYRYSSVACEMLSCGMSAVCDRLSSDTQQMNKLCDFINSEPPLNPLLASFFSKTIRVLLEQGAKQDWYSYHIICLRVLEFLKARTDFLPNLYRHIGTSAIMDTLKYLIRLELFGEIILGWLETHQFLESLIQMICGTYTPEEISPPPSSAAAPTPPAPPPPAVETLNGDEKTDPSKEVNGENGESNGEGVTDQIKDGLRADLSESRSRAEADAMVEAYQAEMQATRVAVGRSANAANLMCEIILVGFNGDGCNSRKQSGAILMQQCKSERIINLLLQSMFTSPLEFRRHAVVNGVQVLLAALQDDPTELELVNAESRRTVVSAVAPHLPLLHQTLLQEPPQYPYIPQNRKTVGMARLQVATLIASLTGSPAEEVTAALVALGTLSTLLDLFFSCPGNNFLHAQVYRAISAALRNLPYQMQYARHILIECDLLRRLMDTFEENQRKECGDSAPRAGYMGHVVTLLELLQLVLDERLYELAGVPDELGIRWAQFKEDKMQPLFRETPLGGCHPSDTNYESESPADANYEYNGVAATAIEEQELGVDDNATDEVFDKYYSNYHQYDSEQMDPEGGSSAAQAMAFSNKHSQRHSFDDDEDDDKEWDWAKTYQSVRLAQGASEPKYPSEIIDAVSPWESAGGSANTEEGWAQFSNAEDQEKFGTTLPDEFVPFWNFSQPTHPHDNDRSNDEAGLQRAMQNLSVLGNDNLQTAPPHALVSNLLTAISSISPEAFAGLTQYPESERPLDNIERTVERQCEPMDESSDSPDEPTLPSVEKEPAER